MKTIDFKMSECWYTWHSRWRTPPPWEGGPLPADRQSQGVASHKVLKINTYVVKSTVTNLYRMRIFLKNWNQPIVN